MRTSTAEKRRTERQAAAVLARELAVLATATTSELAARLEALTGQKTRTRNRAHLRKRVGWLVQAEALGGLSEAALARIEELAPPIAKLRARAGSGARGEGGVKLIVGRPARDPRLPEGGTVLVRAYGGVEHAVTVLDDGFEYEGRRYGSLSRIAREITKTPWNGLVFFGLSKRGEKVSRQEDAA